MPEVRHGEQLPTHWHELRSCKPPKGYAPRENGGRCGGDRSFPFTRLTFQPRCDIIVLSEK